MKKTAIRSVDTDSFQSKGETLALAVDVVSAYVTNNTVSESDLPALIGRVFETLVDLSCGKSAASERPEPAAPIRKSVFPDYIVCLEDGKQLKMLKRHLRTAYGMTPDAYRERWGLPPTYPMTAPNYAKKRSRLARENGLGRKRTGRKGAKAAD